MGSSERAGFRLSAVGVLPIIADVIRYEAYIQKDWEETGLANLFVSRARDDGSADFTILLIDLFCLGVKDVLFETDVAEADLHEFVKERLPDDFRERFHPACAKKMIEGALAYAESLGFAPHRDFRKARKILSGLDASICPKEFTYGCDGRPCYVRGSDDSEDRVNRVLAVLEAHCGAGGFDYEDPGADEEEDALTVRDDLMAWLDAEPESVPRFYEVSGLVTAMLLCPTVSMPTKVLDVLWGPAGRTWQNQEEVQKFLDLLMDYWNQVNNLILDTIAPDAPTEAHPVDVWLEDFPENDGLAMTAGMVAWATGFMRATTTWPNAWGETLTRPDLAPHWEVVRWWAQIEKPEHRDQIATAAESNPPQTITSAVTALARALRSFPRPPE